jgi:hypothetical protein
MDPVLGKSVVLYARKPIAAPSPDARVSDRSETVDAAASLREVTSAA